VRVCMRMCESVKLREWYVEMERERGECEETMRELEKV